MGGRQGRDGYVAGSVVESEAPNETSVTVRFPRNNCEDANGNMYCKIGKDDEDGYRCYPYRIVRLRYVILISLCVITAGLLWLVFYWRPDWKLKFTHALCTFQDKFDAVYLETRDGTNRVFVSSIKVTYSGIKNHAPHLFDSKYCLKKDGERHINKKPSETFKNVHTNISESESSLQEETVIYFIHQYVKYFWEDGCQTFIKTEGFDGKVTFKNLHDAGNRGLQEAEQMGALDLYGENVIHVEVPSYLKLLMSEVLNPFYVFQLFACIFWMVDEYYAYATAIIIISTISAIVSLINVRRERQSLHDIVEHHNTEHVTVVREIKRKICEGGPSTSAAEASTVEYTKEDIWVKNLIPGDVVEISKSGMHLSFDAVLLSGTCIVNESMLTGESVPITKTTLPSGNAEMDKIYSANLEKTHTLFSGTEVIQTRYYPNELIRAVVVRTGFGTAKGMLVHSILFPKPVDLKLMQDAYRFVGVLFCVAMLGFVYSTVVHILQNDTVRDMIFASLDIITITVPPALPLAMTIGIIYAQARLKRANIHTVSPQRINISGQTDVVAFDKTGTLTEDGLDLSSILIVEADKFSSPMSPQQLQSLDRKSNFIRCMATCHSLTLLNEKITGDPLDVKMFEAAGWELVEPQVEDESKYDQLQTTFVRPIDQSSFKNESKVQENLLSSCPASEHELGIIRQFPFMSALKRTSVIVKQLNSASRDMIAFVKGAPETVAKLCVSSVPADFENFLKLYTRQGYRVIALAFKPLQLTWLKAQKIERQFIENELHFLGLLVLHNKLKPGSAGVLHDLENALIRTVMVTGDNLDTAMSVAYDCQLLKQNIPVLVAKVTEDTSSHTLTWYSLDNFDDSNRSDFPLDKDEPRRSHLSSSEESGTYGTIVNMGDARSPYECQLAVTGREFSIIRKYFPEFIPALSVQGTVFARMSPQQKTELMEDLDAVGYHILMCGDGANDCGALKRAHVGISLSEYDASVAAPFTACGENSIGSVTTLIREGRAALVTSFGMFKFMALYSLIQFTTVLLLYRSSTNMSDYQFLYIDLIVIDVVAVTMSRNHAHKILHKKKPPSSLVSAEMLMSLFLQILLQFGLQLLPYILVQNQCWFATPVFYSGSGNETEELPTAATVSPCYGTANSSSLVFSEDDYQRTYETTSLFFVSSFMYLSTSVAFSRGRPFRSPIYKNRWFLFSLLILTGFTLFLMFGAPPELEDFMLILHIGDTTFLLILVAIISGHFITSLFIELIFVEKTGILRYFTKRFTCFRRAGRKKYQHIKKFLLGQQTPENTLDGGFWSGGNEIFIPSMLVGRTINARVRNYDVSGGDCQFKTKL